ncbi:MULTISPECIES: TrkH family potassium uptake protein [Terrabacteria group]|uniref:TrkH family potassium uptake protein n=1 Tax=Bacillati TaxID=1783272 RepID=UPI00193A6333|nr:MULTISPECIES: potassium transporter TrkG [Terrabacteria group]MBW9212565.1 Trk family potassium uptake protein [Trueperella sp. zg.1013]QRG86683.1 Trk family potassium uptake protein [Bulleidia sp. zg-1006]
MKKLKLSSFQVILLGFLGLILIGAFLLMLPISSKENIWTPFINALFTSTSASCVTGLVVHDTGTYWSSFGQFIILLLIQIGGLGIITALTAFSLGAHRHITLSHRKLLVDSVSAPYLGGIVRFIKMIFKITFGIEGIFACVLAFQFIPEFGVLKGVWFSIFHSISAFCNAGFDLLGTPEHLFPSLTAYVGNPLVTLSIAFLIILGGLSFMTYEDFRTHHFHFKKYRLQTKIILVTTLFLLVIPTLYFFLSQYRDLPWKERLLASIFQAVTPRTAGFNTTDMTKLSENSLLIMSILMTIGGAPGSTAGGMKVTTFATMLISSFAIFRQKERCEAFGRTIPDSVVKNAATIFMLYISACIISAIMIAQLENIPIIQTIFETASAVGTVGLTVGITPTLGTISRCILIFLMLMGRIGGVTLMISVFPNVNKNRGKLVEEHIVVG